MLPAGFAFSAWRPTYVPIAIAKTTMIPMKIA